MGPHGHPLAARCRPDCPPVPLPSEHLTGCCVRPGAMCDCDLIVGFMVEDAEKEANRG